MKLSTAVLVISAASTVAYAKNTIDKYNLLKARGPPFEPELPGVILGKNRPKLILAADTNYPPFAELGPPEEDFPLQGFAVEFAQGLEKVCDIDVFTLETKWDNCWVDETEATVEGAGQGIMNGWHHACMSYTHTSGVRNRFLEFSLPILDDNQKAGLLTRLDADGKPHVSSLSDLSGLKVVDVTNWAPTPDTLQLVTNQCTGEKFQGYEIVTATATDGRNENDNALLTLLRGDADAVWLYASQAEEYSCTKLTTEKDKAPYDCDLWDGLGKDFAYIHTGIEEHSRAGTTLTIARKGAGIAKIVNPCIEAFQQTRRYYKLCKRYGLVDSCFPNEYFPANVDEIVRPPYELKTDEVSTECSDGYCSCSEFE